VSCDTFSPRCLVAAVSRNESEILILGGKTGKGTFDVVGDIHILNTERNILTEEKENEFNGYTCLSNQCQVMGDGSVACLVEDVFNYVKLVSYKKGNAKITER